MAKLTKAQRKDLERVLRQAEMVNAYIQRETTLICNPDGKGKPYRSSQFYNEDTDSNICIVEKHYGSTLCQLPTAIESIKTLLENN